MKVDLDSLVVAFLVFSSSPSPSITAAPRHGVLHGPCPLLLNKMRARAGAEAGERTQVFSHKGETGQRKKPLPPVQRRGEPLISRAILYLTPGFIVLIEPLPLQRQR